MRDPAAEYVPQIADSQVRRQAVRVWLFTFATVAAWIFLILAAPTARAYGLTGVSEPIYSLFSYLCHQIPERSLSLLDHQMGVCTRCIGIYTGLLAGTALYPFYRGLGDHEPPRKIGLFAAMIPIGLDSVLGIFGFWENSQFTRFLTGAILGSVCAVFIVPAVLEIVRNLKRRRAPVAAVE